MRNKFIFITNGMARCGKDTFATFLNEIIPTLKYSSIDKVKEIAKLCGWDGGKTEKDRKFLSDLKMLTTAYSNMPFNAVADKVTAFLNDNEHEILLIDIREPEEIEKAKLAFGAKAIFIENNRVKTISSNPADSNVFNYDYDYIVENNGSLEEFKDNIIRFVRENILSIHNMTREEKLRFIKSHEEAPYNQYDPYYIREPWTKFGGISSGICMEWNWYRDDVILSNVTDEDLNKAYMEIATTDENIMYWANHRFGGEEW